MILNWKQITKNAIKFFIIFFFSITIVYFLAARLLGKNDLDWDAITKLYISFFPPLLTLIVTISIFYFDRRNQAAKTIVFSDEVFQELKKHKEKLGSISNPSSDLRFIWHEVNSINSPKIQYLYKNGLLIELDSILFEHIINITFAKDRLIEQAEKPRGDDHDLFDKIIRGFASESLQAIDSFEKRVIELKQVDP